MKNYRIIKGDISNPNVKAIEFKGLATTTLRLALLNLETLKAIAGSGPTKIVLPMELIKFFDVKLKS